VRYPGPSFLTQMGWNGRKKHARRAPASAGRDDHIYQKARKAESTERRKLLRVPDFGVKPSSCIVPEVFKKHESTKSD